MDYCSSCRRHLNGALVCPGCGAYAPDIAPSVAGPARPATPGPAATGRQPDPGPWFDASFHDGAAHAAALDDDPSDLPEDVEGAEGVTGAPQGRAARRRQRARWKKNQRRAVVATAVALVGGGLTLTSLDRQSGDRAQAATAPEQPHTELSRQRHIEPSGPAQSAPDGSEAPRGDTSSPKPSATDVAREPVSSSHTTRRVTRPDAPSSSTTAASQAPRTQPSTPPPAATTPGTGGGGTQAGGQQQTAEPAPSDDTGTGATPAPDNPQGPQDNTSPAQLCVLNLLCLG
ncbi:SCO2400 family protein [Streptomyces nigra]|uniref:SCO2400 family protein n=1 Tax=Streptomyces nigra TaxID=1827580 RepID=UPI0036ADECFC